MTSDLPANGLSFGSAITNGSRNNSINSNPSV